MKLILGLVLGALIVGGTPVHAAAGTVVGPARVLIVGDSVTQGKAGDYTWRYRLWNTLRANKVAVDFVGPRTTLADGSTDYADPKFDQDHAARWGAAMISDGWWVTGFAPDYTQDTVATFHPDVIVNDLGFNNLHPYGGTDADPASVIALAQGFVSDVRAQAPHATIIFGQLTQIWATSGIATYNGMLLDMAASLDRPDARVLVATAPSDYAQADTYDGVHPNSDGEIKIARQFSDVLLGLGLPTDPVPAPPTPIAPVAPVAYAGAARLAAAARQHAVRLTFTTPAEATMQQVWKRDVTAGGRWRAVAHVAPTAHRYRVAGLRAHHRYAFRLRAYSGTLASTAYSNRAAARVG